MNSRITKRSDFGTKHPKCEICGHSKIRHYNITGAGDFCPVKDCVCSFDKKYRKVMKDDSPK